MTEGHIRMYWSKSYSANVDIFRWLHDFLRFFKNGLTNHFNPNKSKYKVCLPFYDFRCQTGCSLLNWRLRIRPLVGMAGVVVHYSVLFFSKHPDDL